MSKYVRVIREYDLRKEWWLLVPDDWDEEVPEQTLLSSNAIDPSGCLDEEDLDNCAEETIMWDEQPPEGAEIIDLTANTTGETKQGQPSQD